MKTLTEILLDHQIAYESRYFLTIQTGKDAIKEWLTQKRQKYEHGWFCSSCGTPQLRLLDELLEELNHEP